MLLLRDPKKVAHVLQVSSAHPLGEQQYPPEHKPSVLCPQCAGNGSAQKLTWGSLWNWRKAAIARDASLSSGPVDFKHDRNTAQVTG